LDVELAVEGIVGRLAQIDPVSRKRRRELADQLERACMSRMLNPGESVGNQGGNRPMRIETAAGSAGEIRRGLRFAMLWGHVERGVAEPIDRDLDRVLATPWKMRQRCG
jgi:hypothetical protein